MFSHCKSLRSEPGSPVASCNHCKIFWWHFMETCLRVQAKDTTKNPHQNPHKENANKFCYPAQLLTGDYAGLKQYHLARRWERTCPEMQDALVQFANNSRGVTGSLELREAEAAGGNTEAEYRCILQYVEQSFTAFITESLGLGSSTNARLGSICPQTRTILTR